MLAIEQASATLAAAGMAAIVGTLTLFLQLFGARRAEMRAAHRSALAPHLDELGESIHENLSFSVLIRFRALDGNDMTDVLRNGRRAADELKALRRRVRYTLPGLEEPLRIIARLPDWVALQRNLTGGGADKLIDAGRALQEGVDAAVRRSYRTGLPPGRIRSWTLTRKAKAVRELHEKRYEHAPDKPSATKEHDDPVP